jgi:hypothetical protein
MELKLINGHFMRGSEEEKPEIGNFEQIQLLRKQEKYFEKIEKGMSFVADVEEDEDELGYIITANVKCVCGSNVYFKVLAESDDIDYLELSESLCRVCRKKYIIELNEHGNLVVKFND